MARSDRFRHEAILYAGPDEFVAATAPVLHAAMERDEPVLVVVDQPKIALLRSALDSRADRIRFADMRMVGHNPARIIPEWRAFVDEHAGWRGTIHGIGEPIWSGRTSTALVECRHHEALLNLAFADDVSFCVQCPLDVAALPATVADEAHRTHPFLWRNGELRATNAHGRLDPARVFEDPLTDAPGRLIELKFDGRSFVGVRRLRHAACLGRSRHRGLRGDRPRSHRRPAGRPAAPSPDRHRWTRTVDGQPALRPRPDPVDVGENGHTPAQAPPVIARSSHVVLVGGMAVGKTTVGWRVAVSLRRPLRDSDIDLEAARGTSGRELAERDGTAALHRWEADHLLRALASPEPQVVAAAASVVDDDRCLHALAAPFVAWLRAPAPMVL